MTPNILDHNAPPVTSINRVLLVIARDHS